MAALSRPPAGHGSINKRVGLPLIPEILELIFREMDASTFFIALQTCKQFAEAGSTRKNLLYQIGRIPGGQPCWERSIKDLPIEELRHRCCQHAAKSGCMAWVLADLRRCEIPLGTMLSKSTFSNAHISKSTSLSVSRNSHVALADEDGRINIYSLANNDIKQTLLLDLLDPNSPYRRTKVYALAFSRKGDLVVIHGQGVRIRQRDERRKHRKIHHSDGTEKKPNEEFHEVEVFEVITFFHCTDDSKNPAAYRKAPRRSQTLGMFGAEPVGIALACNGNASVAWKVRKQGNNYFYHIDLLRITSGMGESIDPWDNCDATYHELSIKGFEIVPDDSTSCHSINMKFIEKEQAFLISKGALPLYHYFSYSGTDDLVSRWLVHDRVTVDFTNSQRVERESFRIGTPFFRRHAPDHPKRLRARASCFSTYLALGVLNILPYNLKDDHYLYVLMQQEADDSTNCRRRAQMDRIFLRDAWTPVALLAGWRSSRSSVGSLLETTLQGNRIASADWDRVLVWTIHPEELCKMNLKVYFPARDYNTEKELGRIRPILLPPQGVVHAMKWIDQDVLFAVTDRGLVSWDVGPNASGKRWIDEAPGKRTMSHPSSQKKRRS